MTYISQKTVLRFHKSEVAAEPDSIAGIGFGPGLAPEPTCLAAAGFIKVCTAEWVLLPGGADRGANRRTSHESLFTLSERAKKA